jgi:isocitrate lyase
VKQISQILEEAKRFAEAIKKEYPEKMLAYNCSPSFNWKKHLDDFKIGMFQKELGAMGYKFQFITLAGFHNLNLSTFKLAKSYAETGMSAYASLQQEEFSKEAEGYSAIKHQREVGVSYYDKVSEIISAGQSSTTAMQDSTESEQF